MKKFLMLMAILIFWPVVSSAERINGLDVEWEDATTYTLSWTNPSISRGDYVINVVDFDWKGNAVISVTRHGVMQSGILSTAETTTLDFTADSTVFQGIRIKANTVSDQRVFPINIGTYPCCPAAEISVEVSKTEKKPALELTRSLKWDGRSGYTSKMDIQIKNTGNGAFAEGNITMNISGLEPANDQELSAQGLTYNPSKSTVTRVWFNPLLANNSYNISLSLRSPSMAQLNQSTFTIIVDSYFKDFNGNIYPATGTATVSLDQSVTIDKRITESTITGERDIDDSIYRNLGKITVVDIYVKNLQGYPVRSVNLTDNVIEGFRLVDNKTKLQWIFDLEAGEKKEFRYEMIAQRTGTFTAPAAVAEWTEFGAARTASSNTPVTRVYGVFVLVSKSTEKLAFSLNESINVTVRLENIGDFPAGINLTDILPGNTTLISGNTTINSYLHPHESVYITYSLFAGNPGEFELPQPQVSFWKNGYKDLYGFVSAQNITVLKSLPAEVPGTGQNITSTPLELSSVKETPASVSTPLSTPEPAPVPKSLLDIIDERAPWLEGALPMIMLFIAIILISVLHINR